MTQDTKKEHYEALNKAGISTTSAKLLFGIIKILTKKAGPKLKENGYSGLAIIANVNNDGTMNPVITVYKTNGEKTTIPLVTGDFDEAEEQALNDIENGNKN